MLIMILFYTDDGKQIMVLTLSFAWNLVFTRIIVYELQVELIQAIPMMTGAVVVFLIIMTIFGMIFIHISRIHNNLYYSN